MARKDAGAERRAAPPPSPDRGRKIVLSDPQPAYEDSKLGQIVRDHIDRYYHGSQAEFARKLGLKQQYVQKMTAGGIHIPTRPFREVLGPELNMRPVDFFVLVGELAEEDVAGGDAPWAADDLELLTALRDLSPEDLRIVVELTERFAGKPLPRARAALMRLAEGGSPRSG